MQVGGNIKTRLSDLDKGVKEIVRKYFVEEMSK